MIDLDKLTDEILNKFALFTNGINCIMLIDRGVANSNKGSRRWINKIITTDTESYRDAVRKLLEMQYHINNPDIRLYASVNSRNLDKAINMFKHRQLDVLPDTILKFYTKINNTFCSCLMKPENKLTKYFLLDIDEESALEASVFTLAYNINILMIYKTKNGWHFIVKPFDTRLADIATTFTVKKDGLLLLHYMSDEQ